MLITPHDAYSTGWQAQADGRDDHENPHIYGTPEWDAWQQGWGAGDEDARLERRVRQ